MLGKIFSYTEKKVADVLQQLQMFWVNTQM